MFLPDIQSFGYYNYIRHKLGWKVGAHPLCLSPPLAYPLRKWGLKPSSLTDTYGYDDGFICCNPLNLVRQCFYPCNILTICLLSLTVLGLSQKCFAVIFVLYCDQRELESLGAQRITGITCKKVSQTTRIWKMGLDLLSHAQRLVLQYFGRVLLTVNYMTAVYSNSLTLNYSNALESF